MPKIIGIFGGTFDPVHNGHTDTISYLVSLIPFYKINVIPNFMPPHKKARASFEDRLAMVKLAFRNIKQVTVDDRDSLKKGPSYAINTVKEIFKEEEKNAQIVMIVGTDTFSDIDSWYRWEELMKLVDFLVMKRSDNNLSKEKKSFQLIDKNVDIEELKNSSYKRRVIEVNVKPINISSSRIRQNIRVGKSIDCLVNSEVRDYLNINKLYGSKNSTK